MFGIRSLWLGLVMIGACAGGEQRGDGSLATSQTGGDPSGTGWALPTSEASSDAAPPESDSSSGTATGTPAPLDCQWVGPTLLPRPPTDIGAFGHGVGVRPGRVLVGGTQAPDLTGIIYAIEPTDHTWTDAQLRLPPISDPLHDPVGSFGVHVALGGFAGERAFVGAPGSGVQPQVQGHVHEFVWDGMAWQLGTSFTMGDPEGLFGGDLDVSEDGETLVVGNLEADMDGLEQAGAVFVFVKRDGNWVSFPLRAEHPIAGHHFGTSVAVSADGSTVVVGSCAPEFEGAEVEVEVFAVAGSVTRIASLGGGNAFECSAVDISGSTIIVGEYRAAESAGGVYLCDTQGGCDALPSTGREERDYLGLAVAIDGDIAVAGAPGTLDKGGSVDVYVRTDGHWGLEAAKVRPTDGAPGDAFGKTLDISGSMVVIGAPAADKAYALSCELQLL